MNVTTMTFVSRLKSHVLYSDLHFTKRHVDYSKSKRI